jgi:GTP cyclohydrolase II
MKVESWCASTHRYRQRKGRPLVTLSYAQSLDGSIAARRGVPLSLSGRESLRLWHRLRVCHDAILVGIGTVLTDDPQLNVRLVTGNDPQPVILDTRLRFPLKALALNSGKPPWIITSAKSNPGKKKKLESRGAEVIRLRTTSERRIDLTHLLEYLEQRKINSVMVEGGARVITSFLRAELADYFVLTITPFFVGGLRAVEQLTPRKRQGGPIRLNSAKIIGSRWYGRDLVIWGEFQ